MKDHVVPFCADQRHAPDTVFLILEEDFRLFPDDAAQQQADRRSEREWKTLPKSRAMSAGMLRQRNALHAGTARCRATRSVPQPKAGDNGGFLQYRRPPKPSASDFERPSVHLRNLLALVNAADIHNRGNLVWLSYCPANDKYRQAPRTGSQYISGGSTLISLTARGARWLRQEFHTLARFHFDWSLLQALVTYDWQAERNLGASMVVPCIGSFCAHVSGCSVDTEYYRTGLWHNPYVQAGTQKESNDEVHRGIYEFPKGPKPENLIVRVELPRQLEEFRHITIAAPVAEQRTDKHGRPRTIEWWGGQLWEYVGGHRATYGWRVVELYVNDEEDALGASAQVTSKRQARRRRAILRDYSRRNFEEARRLVYRAGCVEAVLQGRAGQRAWNASGRVLYGSVWRC